MRRKILVGLALALLAAWIWFAVRPSPEDRLAALVAELRARGEPVTLADMERPLPPDDQNGALDLDAAMAWFEAHEPESGWESRVAGPWNYAVPPPYEENYSPEQLEARREFLVFLAPLFERVDRGADKPEIAWPLPPRDTAEGCSELSVMVPVIQDLQRFLSTRASFAATAADRRRAMRSTLEIGNRLRTRTALDHLVAATVFSAACGTVREALADGRIDPQLARETLDDSFRVHWERRFAAMVRGERADQLEAIPFWLDGSMHEALGLGEPPSVGGWLVDGVKELLRGRLDFDPPEDRTEMIGWTRDLQRFLDSELTARETFELHSEMQGNLIALMVPRIREKLVHADVQSGLARIALAAYEHRRLHGDWPASSEDLAPLFPDGVPVDRVTGEPFAFEHAGESLVLRATPLREATLDGEDPFELGYEWRLPVR